jgi:hypothetical protein
VVPGTHHVEQLDEDMPGQPSLPLPLPLVAERPWCDDHGTLVVPTTTTRSILRRSLEASRSFVLASLRALHLDPSGLIVASAHQSSRRGPCLHNGSICYRAP